MRLCFTALALVAIGVHAQAASLTGRVTDPWDIAVPGAILTLNNLSTGVTLTSTDKPAGDYTFSQLAPGRYDLSVHAEGFRPYTRHDLEFAGDADSHMNVSLDPEKEAAGRPIKELVILVDSKPDDYQAHYNLGRAYYANGSLDNAVLQFQQALRVRPADPAAELGLAQTALRGGAPESAARIALAIIEAQPGNGMAAVIAASAYLRMRQPDEAAKSLEKLLATHPYDSEALIESGIVDTERKRYAEAEKVFRQAYSIDPSNLQGLRGLANIQFAQKEPEKAVQAIAAEVEKHPDRLDLRKELATTEFRAGQSDKAIADYRSILEKSPADAKNQAELYARIGGVYRERGDYSHAIENLKKAAQLAPENSAYTTSLATAYDLSGDAKDALEYYKQTLKLDPKNPIVMNNEAYLLVKSGGDLDEALRLVQMARRQLPELGEILDTLGWIYLKKDMVDSASQIFHDLVEKTPANATFHYHYAIALAQQGDKTGALKELDLAMQNKPSKDQEEQIKEMIKKLS